MALLCRSVSSLFLYNNSKCASKDIPEVSGVEFRWRYFFVNSCVYDCNTISTSLFMEFWVLYFSSVTYWSMCWLMLTYGVFLCNSAALYCFSCQVLSPTTCMFEGESLSFGLPQCQIADWLSTWTCLISQKHIMQRSVLYSEAVRGACELVDS